jgi:succinate dehydrogenase/fumarate reductase flavoprotein subunit
LPRTTVTQNVMLPLLYHPTIPAKERAARALKAVETVGLGDRKDYMSSQLSGGQKQRVAIARALTQGPEILLADEPVASLDPATCHTVMDYLRKANRELGLTMWDYVGMSRSDAGLKKAIGKIQGLRAEFWENLKLCGGASEFNKELEMAGRVADFFELAELMALDALERNESCGGHFREEYQTPEGEALRNDEHYSHVAAWEYAGEGKKPILNKEPLSFDNVHLAQRSYK